MEIKQENGFTMTGKQIESVRDIFAPNEALYSINALCTMMRQYMESTDPAMNPKMKQDALALGTQIITKFLVAFTNEERNSIV